MVRSVLRQLGMMVPQLRHLVESRAEAVAARDAAVAQLALASGESRRQVLDAMLA